MSEASSRTWLSGRTQPGFCWALGSCLVLQENTEARKVPVTQTTKTSKEVNERTTNPPAGKGSAVTMKLKTANRRSAGDPQCLKVQEKCFFQEAR